MQARLVIKHPQKAAQTGVAENIVPGKILSLVSSKKSSIDTGPISLHNATTRYFMEQLRTSCHAANAARNHKSGRHTCTQAPLSNRHHHGACPAQSHSRPLSFRPHAVSLASATPYSHHHPHRCADLGNRNRSTRHDAYTAPNIHRAQPCESNSNTSPDSNTSPNSDSNAKSITNRDTSASNTYSYKSYPPHPLAVVCTQQSEILRYARSLISLCQR